MTWDNGRLRPNNRRQVYRNYPPPRTALTPFDVRPFAYPANAYDEGCYLVRKPVLTSRGWRMRRVEVCG